MPVPPAPPPPPPLYNSASVLSSGRRQYSNSYREAHPPVPAPSKSSTPGLDAQTLQHAAAGLRKTQHNQSVRSDFENLSNGRMDRTDVQLSGRYWQDRSLNEPMESNQTRETFHATSYDPRHAVQISNVYRHPDSLRYNSTERPAAQQYYTSSSSQSQYSTYQQQSSGGTDESPYIMDPRAHIRAYATQTSAYPAVDKSPTSEQYGRQEYHNKTRDAYINANKFVKELRDQGLTRTQRIANQFQESQIRDIAPPKSMDELYKQKEQLGGDQIDMLIRDMEWKMKTGVGAAGEYNCFKCGEGITNDRPGCAALDQMFHVACFTCKECGKQLAGSSFYNVDGKPLCEQDYKNTLERCTSCGEIIMDKLLRASGNPYHPRCFVCSVCKKCLDGIPFTVDSSNKIHCVDCFHDKFAPRCAVCSKPIVPEEGEKESVRVVAMDKSFHVNCYRCEDCNMQLSSKLDGQGCYPLDQHLYCKNCNGKRLIALSRAA